MTSTFKYTTAAKVKERIKNYNTDATDSQIDTFISHSEGLINVTTKNTWVTSIPELIESIATDLAAIYLLVNDPSGFTSSAEAAFMADVLWATAKRNLKLANDPTVIRYMKGDSDNA